MGTYTFRFASTVTEEQRAVIEAKAAAMISRPGRQRAHNYERARVAASDRAHTLLTGPCEPPRARGKIVRIYYISTGGDTLCCESDVLTTAQADRLHSEVAHSAARDVQVYDAALRGTDDAPVLWYGSRLVTLPSQMGPQEPIAVEPEPIAVEPEPIAARLRAVALFRAAAARRSERLARWHRLAA